MRRIPDTLKNQIILLRTQGKSIPEIVKFSGAAKTTVQRYVLGVEIPKEFYKELREKQGGSKERAKALRENSIIKAQSILGNLSERDHLLVLVALYWGEGTKKDFSIMNSDPKLIQAFIVFLYSFGVGKDRLIPSLRMHSDISIRAAKEFWSYKTGLPISSFKAVEVIQPGKKKGKLPYGMCRIRVVSGIRERILIQSIISCIGKQAEERILSD